MVTSNHSQRYAWNEWDVGQRENFPGQVCRDLRDISVLDASDGYGLAVDVDKGRAAVLLVHPADDQLLTKGMRIRVSGYEEWGDEGGS